MTLDLLLVAGVVIPLISFVFLAFFGSRLPGVAPAGHGHDDHGHGSLDDHGHGGHDDHSHAADHGHAAGHGEHHFPPKIKRPSGGNPIAGLIATAAIALSCVLATTVLVRWVGMSPSDRVEYSARVAADHSYYWGDLGKLKLSIAVNLDSLTVIMFFMVTFVSTWIHVFSLGYMREDPRFARFFTFLSLFCFSMLGLVVANSLLFLFIFWELVGLCSYFLIGFWFEKKSASNAAIKAFVTNRVGDFGFIIGLAMVVMYLGDVSLAGAAASFRRLADDPTAALFTQTFWGLNLATWMGIGLFCGAVGKSAQFPLHVWLPDAMEGPTPVSALIHAATMVAAGVYLVARIFALLTPQAQFVIAIIGCITLTMTALIAVVQTDIKKVLAYSTLSQLGYMIFGMGVGAWVGALFHLLTHAFFKALLFLGSGQVIAGCHHEQDIRRMGGLRKKMPVTCWTFFLAVLAIAGAGIPYSGFGIGGYFSKDEILAVAYHRSYLHDRPLDHGESEHSAAAIGSAAFAAEPAGTTASDSHGHSTAGNGAAGHAISSGSGHPAGHDSLATLYPDLRPLPKWMFWLPIIVAYITPFYMMRCWVLTFAGKPRDEHVHEHAHETPIMWVPLVVLAVSSVLCASIPVITMRNLVLDAAHAAPTEKIGSRVSSLTPALNGEQLHEAHEALGKLVGVAFLVGMGAAYLLYRNGLGAASAIMRMSGAIRAVHRALMRRLYIDDAYDLILVGGTIVLAKVCQVFDAILIDGIVNLSAALTRVFASFTGRQLDMPVRGGDIGFVDAIVNGIGSATRALGDMVRQPQTGRIRWYILSLAGVAAVILVAVAFQDQWVPFLQKVQVSKAAAATVQSP